MWIIYFWEITNSCKYTECTKHKGHLPNIELHPLLPSEQPQFVRAWTLQGVERVLQECWPMLTPMLPPVVSSCLDVPWVVDHSWYTRETVEREKPSSVAVLDTNRCSWHLLPYPVQRHLNILSFPFTLWMSHTHNPCLNCRKGWNNFFSICLLPFICTDWSGFNKWHQYGMTDFTWIHLVSLFNGKSRCS